MTKHLKKRVKRALPNIKKAKVKSSKSKSKSPKELDTSPAPVAKIQIEVEEVKLEKGKKSKKRNIKKKISTEVVDGSPPPKKKKSKIYWPRSIDFVIKQYNECEVDEEKNDLFNKKLFAPFNKMVETIINRFQFPYIDGALEDIKTQVMGFLIMNMNKYTPEKGKSFSYFSVISKNYLIFHNNHGYKHEKRTHYLSDMEECDDPNVPGESGYKHFPKSVTENINTDGGISSGLMYTDSMASVIDDDSNLKEFTKSYIQFWDDHVNVIFPKDRDRDIAMHIIQLFRNADKIENYNKKSLYLILRQATDTKTSYITHVISIMKSITKQLLSEYYRTGLFMEFDDVDW